AAGAAQAGGRLPPPDRAAHRRDGHHHRIGARRAVSAASLQWQRAPRGPFALAVCLNGYTVLDSPGALLRGFAVKKNNLFLYSAIHKLSTPCAQVIHRREGPRARVLKFAPARAPRCCRSAVSQRSFSMISAGEVSLKNGRCTDDRARGER